MSAHVVSKAALYPDDEQTNIDGGWEDNNTTTDKGQALSKARVPLEAPASPQRRTGTSETSVEEPTVDDQRASAAIQALLAAPGVARLIVTQGSDAGREFEIRPGKSYTIGRAIDNDVVLTDIAVSRHHFDLAYEDGRWLLRDRGSGNGTVVNGNIEDHPFGLAHGDAIEIGTTAFRFDHKQSADAEATGLPWERQADEDDPSTIAQRPSRAMAQVEPRAASKPSRSTEAETRPEPRFELDTRPAPRVDLRSSEAPRESGREGRFEPPLRAASSAELSAPQPPRPRERARTMPPPPPQQRALKPTGPPGYPGTPPQLLHSPPSVAPGPLGALGPPGPLGAPGVSAAPPGPLSASMLSRPAPLATAASPMTSTLVAEPLGAPPGPLGLASGPLSQSMVAAAAPAGFGYLGPLGPGVSPPASLGGSSNFGPPVSSGLQIAATAAARDAPPTALVAPMAFGAPEAVYVPPQLSRRAKINLAMGAGLFVVIVAIIGIVAGGKHPSGPISTPDKPSGSAGSAAHGVTPHGPTVEPIKSEPANAGIKVEPIKPEPAKPEPAKPAAAEPAKPEPAKPEPAKPEPAKPEPAKPDPAKPVVATPAPTKPIVATPAPTKPAPAKPAPAKPAPKPNKVAKAEPPRKPPPPRKPTPDRRRLDTSAATSKADEQYRGKGFTAAAATLRAAAKGVDEDTASSLRSRAGLYENLGKAYAVGGAPGTKAVEAYNQLRKAEAFDRELGGGFGQDIRDKLVGVAPKAAMSYMASKNYEEAFQVVRAAEGFGASKDGTIAAVHQALEARAAELYKTAMSEKDDNPDDAKAQLKRILKIVDGKSPWYQKASKSLAGG